MFNENKIWHSVQEKRNFYRQQRTLQTNKRRRLQFQATQKRLTESRPFFRKSTFQTVRHDKRRYERLVGWYGEGEQAKGFYHKEVHPKTNTFWWEEQFKHEKYITATGRAFFKAKEEAKDRVIRDNFKVFLTLVPNTQHKRLKAWVDHCDTMNEYSNLFKNDDGIDEDEFLEDEIAYTTVDWPEVLPVPIIRSLLFLSKSWPASTIPVWKTRAKKNVEVEKEKPVNEGISNEEEEDVYNTDTEEFTGGW